MTECKFEDLIDEYLLNTISEEKRNQFEEHYFNCPACFQKMAARDDMITAIKWKGHEIFSDLMEEEQIRKVAVWDRLFGFMAPRQWALAAVSAALVLVVTFGVIPALRTQSPQFTLDDHQTRGQSITLIS
ncbi:MAG: anti-sigma factor, partial [Candidatus Aminicenantaceae bacterium]